MSTILKVGALYVPTRTRWPEGAEYNLSAYGHDLRLFFDRPTSVEIKAVRKGSVQFGLFVPESGSPVLWLLTRFGDQPWMDAPYSWWMVPESIRVAPDPVAGMTPNTRVKFQIVLVDASTGILRAIRWVTGSPEFTRELHGAIEAQIAGGPITRGEYDRVIRRTNVQHDTNSMVSGAVVTCVGG